MGDEKFKPLLPRCPYCNEEIWPLQNGYCDCEEAQRVLSKILLQPRTADKRGDKPMGTPTEDIDIITMDKSLYRLATELEDIIMGANSDQWKDTHIEEMSNLIAVSEKLKELGYDEQ